MLEEKTIALIGAGVMAEMIAAGLVRSKLTRAEDIIVSHYRPERLATLVGQLSVRATTDNVDACSQADVAVICVRPQSMENVLEQIAPVVKGRVIVSIAAGLPLSLYERYLGPHTPIVRAMPTFFGWIREGTTGLSLNRATSAEHLAIVSRLFGTFSANVIVLPESEMDAFTTFGSTTTATVYMLLDALITAGSLVGLRHQASHARALEQVIAAACNVEATDKRPSQLLDELCTPGGVTVEGVKVLEERATRGAVIDAIIAATERAKQLRQGGDRH